MIVVYLIFLAVIQAVTEFLPVSSLGHLCILEQYGNRPRNRIAVRNDAPSWKCGSNYIFVPQRFKKNRTGTSGDVYGYDR